MEAIFVGLLFLLMVITLGSGFPVAFALPGSAILSIGLAGALGWLFSGDTSAFFAEGGPTTWLSAGVTNFRSIYWDIERDTLIAIPLFVFMGIMLQRSKVAEDLLVTMAQLFGSVRGGLGVSVVIVGALLAATTGIVGATVVAMGLISLPAMLRNGYNKPLATGTICASGTLGQIIPPSIVLIILADQMSNAAEQASTRRREEYRELTGEFSMPSNLEVPSASAGEMFLGALVPGLVLVGLYIAYIFITAFLKPDTAPPVPYEGKRLERAFLLRLGASLVPPLVLIIAVLGSILAGIATVNQAGAIGAVGAIIMGGVRLPEERRHAAWPAVLALVSLAVIFALAQFVDLNVRSQREGLEAFGFAIAVVAVFGFVVSIAWSIWRIWRIQGTLHQVMSDTCKTTAMVFIILLGAAMLTAAFRGFGGEELVRHFLTSLPGGFWTQMFTVMLVIFLLGFFLDFIEIAVVVVPIVAPILLMDPSSNVTAVWLGVMIGLNIQTSFLTPPFGFALFYLRGVATAAVKTLDIYRGAVPFIALQILGLVLVGLTPSLVNYLPNRAFLTSEFAPPAKNPRLQQCVDDFMEKEIRSDKAELTAAVHHALTLNYSALPPDLAESLIAGLEEMPQGISRLEDYFALRATHTTTADGLRELHKEVRRLEHKALRSAGIASDRLDKQARAEVRAEAVPSATLAAWESQTETLSEQAQELRKTRLRLYRDLETLYEPVFKLNAVLSDTPELLALDARLKSVAQVLFTGTSEDVIERIERLEAAFAERVGAEPIRAALSKVRRAVSKGESTKARQQIHVVQKIYQEEIAWRTANAHLTEDINKLDATLRNTIGINVQPRIPRRAALYVARCRANPRDQSLSF